MRRSTSLVAVSLVALLTGQALAQEVIVPGGQAAAGTTQVNRVLAALTLGPTALVTPVGPGVGQLTAPGISAAQQTNAPLVGPYGGFNSIQPGVPAGTAPSTPTTLNGQTATGHPQCARVFAGLGTAVSLGPGVAQVGPAFGGASLFGTVSIAAPGVGILAGSTTGVLPTNAGIATLGPGFAGRGGQGGYAPGSGLAGAGYNRGGYATFHAATPGGGRR
jgi:hypothetical protein